MRRIVTISRFPINTTRTYGTLPLLLTSLESWVRETSCHGSLPTPNDQFPSSAYHLLVNGITGCSTLADGCRYHLYAIRSGLDGDTFLSNSLINMYVDMGNINDGNQVFDEMVQRNTVSWSCIIAGNVRHGRLSEAVSLFSEMRREGFEPTQFAIGSVLRAIGESWDLQQGEIIHGLVTKNGYAPHAVVQNVLMGFYGSCGQFDDAYKVFVEMPERNVVSWNNLISICCRCKQSKDTLELFSEMRQLGVSPNEYTLGSLVSRCTEHVEQMLAHVLKSGHSTNIYVGSAIVSTYARFRDVDDAQKFFDGMTQKNVVSVNGLMVGYVKQGCWEKALEFFSRMRNAGFNMNLDSVVVLLSACAIADGPKWGREVHAHILETGIQYETPIGNALVNMYAKCGMIIEATTVFTLMTKQDQISWNTMISGLDQNGCYKGSVATFLMMMKERLVPANLTFVSTLSSCGNLGYIQHGKQIHCHVIKWGLGSDISVANSLVTMYASCRSISDSCKVFKRMSERDRVSWNGMIGVLAESDMNAEALNYFATMINQGWTLNKVTFLNTLTALSLTPSVDLCKMVHGLILKYNQSKEISVENALISSYAKCGEMRDAEQLFHRMPVRDFVSWNSMIAGYTQNAFLPNAISMVGQMLLVGHRLDNFTCATVLSTCAAAAALELGMQIHAYMIRSLHESDIVVESSLVDMYAKCGRIDYASQLFEIMEFRNEFSWNSMISGYARHGHGLKALELFRKMLEEPDKRPDHVTFVGVLSACSHVGLVDEGLEHFESMIHTHGLTPKVEHYSCMVDLLGRAGQITKAGEIIQSMPMQPNSLIWRTFLGACCRTRCNIELGVKAAERLLELEPQNPVTYILVSNMLALGGKWHDVNKVRTKMSTMRLKKEPGCSWVMMKDGVHMFVAGDSSHPNSDQIYAKLRDLNLRMRNAGYVPQTDFALYDLEVEHKEELLSYHSEKLAVAFVLTRMSGKTPIRIMKNLRICGDCHSAFKFISQIIGRQIIVRDSNRFHHFDAGGCSCGDYW